MMLLRGWTIAFVACCLVPEGLRPAKAASSLSYSDSISSPQPIAGGSFGIAINSFNGNLLVGEPGADKVRMIDLSTRSQVMQLNDPDPPAASVTFGNAMVQAGNKIVVGDGQGYYNGVPSVGNVYVYDGQTGQHLFAIRSPVQQVFNYFGQCLEFAAGTLYVSAENSGNSTGKVYAYNPNTGQLLATINNPDVVGFSYGFGADLEEHGNDLFISAPGNRTAGIDSGAVYQYDALTRALKRKISDPRPTSGALFGQSLDSDASRLLVGAPNADLNGTQYVGEAYLFDAANGGLLRTFANPEPAFLAQFGSSVALIGDLAIVGAPGTSINPSPPGPFSVGAFYVFDVNSGNYLAKFFSPTPGQNMSFTGGGGQNGGLVATGNRLVAATELQSVNGLFNAGQVYVYQYAPEPSSMLLILSTVLWIATGHRRRGLFLVGEGGPKMEPKIINAH